jgi:hypothetical protein
MRQPVVGLPNKRTLRRGRSAKQQRVDKIGRKQSYYGAIRYFLGKIGRRGIQSSPLAVVEYGVELEGVG